MRFTALRFVTAFVGIGCVASFGQAQEERRTVVTPLPEENILRPCEYRMILPETKDPIRAIWTIFDRGQDYLRWYQDRQIRATGYPFHSASPLEATSGWFSLADLTIAS